MSTIDPGVEEGIKQGADEVDDDKPQHNYDDNANDDFLQPGEWWFASTACPLLAGTFGPMATGFNICALVEKWREIIPPAGTEGTGTVLQDPSWEIAINVLSLLCAVVGNASLLLNMARRLRFSIAQPITISGFLLAGVLLIADVSALGGGPHDRITIAKALPSSRHALTSAFYYAIFAAFIYTIIGLLMGLTVYGASKGHYKKEFRLTPSQRTLMLQTMSFIAYLLLGALVYSHIEGWEYLDAVYWADVTLLTVGIGDFAPTTRVGRGLLFPFAIGGILTLGLVVGSIRSLILERGKEKLGARIVEKRRSNAVHNVDDRKQTIKISIFSHADFAVDPDLSPAQRREAEFSVMRKVQDAAETERRWFSLATSTAFALILWFLGAFVFMKSEFEQRWTYFEALYFSYTSLLTIGYGDLMPRSNSGKPFFVLWSLLAVPSLTILISNMGDTIVKWISDLTIWVGSLTVLPGEEGLRASVRRNLQTFVKWLRISFNGFSLPGIFGDAPQEKESRVSRSEYEKMMRDRMAERLTKHTVPDEAKKARAQDQHEGQLDRDIYFYNYVLARECRNVQMDLNASPPKKYEWADWEYFLKLMGNEDDPEDFPGQEHPDILVPEPMRAPSGLNTAAGAAADEKTDVSSEEEPKSTNLTSQADGNVDRRTSVAQHLASTRRKWHGERGPSAQRDWSWLSNESPLMSQKTEAEWILERLSAALERELNRLRMGYRRKPPIGLRDTFGRTPTSTKSSSEGRKDDDAADEVRDARQRHLNDAADGSKGGE